MHVESSLSPGGTNTRKVNCKTSDMSCSVGNSSNESLTIYSHTYRRCYKMLSTHCVII